MSGKYPSDKRIVAKALDDFGDDWHWVILERAASVQLNVFYVRSVRTACGIAFDEGSTQVTLHDTGAPELPTCIQCLASDTDGSERVGYLPIGTLVEV